MQQQPPKTSFDRFLAQQKQTLAPQRPKTGRYVETNGCFNATSTPVVRMDAKVVNK